jgi:4-amino-4-deoxy-L-arabinose transferase-like glycosyltransferase
VQDTPRSTIAAWAEAFHLTRSCRGSPTTGLKADAVALLLLATIWGGAALAINPVGNFPLFDDWAYGYTVRSLIETGELRISGWTATNLVAQVFWAALFCLPFGFSFTALRISTLVLGLGGVFATYGLLRAARASTSLALFGSLVVAFSPIYFGLSFTFMTDVPFTAAATASCWLLLRGLQRDCWPEMLVGLVVAIGAILIRQVGLAIPLAFSIAYLVKRGPSIRHLIEAIIPSVAALTIQFAYQEWLVWSGHIPVNFGKQIRTLEMQLGQDWPTILRDGSTITFYAFLYLGLFLFPFLLIANRLSLPGRSTAALSLSAAAATVMTAILGVCGKLMPMHGIILNAGGIGMDVGPIAAPRYFWLLATFLSVMGAILLLWHLVATILFLTRIPKEQTSDQAYVSVFALALVLISFAPLPMLGLTIDGFFDRYLIVFLPALMLLIVSRVAYAAPIDRPKPHVSSPAFIGTLALVAMGSFSVLATHDWLASHRVLWTALDDLMHDRRLGPEQIDGGFEFNGWYYYHNTPTPERGRSYIVSDEYVVASYLRNGYIALKNYSVDRWLFWGSGDIIVQSRPPSALQ